MDTFSRLLATFLPASFTHSKQSSSTVRVSTNPTKIPYQLYGPHLPQSFSRVHDLQPQISFLGPNANFPFPNVPCFPLHSSLASFQTSFLLQYFLIIISNCLTISSIYFAFTFSFPLTAMRALLLTGTTVSLATLPLLTGRPGRFSAGGDTAFKRS